MSDFDDAIDSLVSQAADGLNSALTYYDNSIENVAFSYLASLPEAYLHDSTPTDLRILSHTDKIEQPDPGYQREHSPSISEFLNAANSEYSTFGTPKNLSPFTVDGKQLEVVDQATGLSARAWITDDSHQVIIAYSGTFGGDTALANPLQIVGQTLADVPSLAGKTSSAQKDSVKFAEYVVAEANKQGIDTNDVFITGHSLGGGEAEYVGQQTGLGGIAFDGTGIPKSSDAVNDSSNFVSIVNYGDVWGSFASDVEGVQPAAPKFNQAKGTLPHWGDLIMVGDPKDQQTLANTQTNNALDVLINFLVNSATYHYPGNQAANLGIDLKPFSVTQDTGAEAQGNTLYVANATLDQLIAANAQRDDYHSPALPTDVSKGAQALSLATITATDA